MSLRTGQTRPKPEVQSEASFCSEGHLVSMANGSLCTSDAEARNNHYRGLSCACRGDAKVLEITAPAMTTQLNHCTTPQR